MSDALSDSFKHQQMLEDLSQQMTILIDYLSGTNITGQVEKVFETSIFGKDTNKTKEILNKLKNRDLEAWTYFLTIIIRNPDYFSQSNADKIYGLSPFKNKVTLFAKFGNIGKDFPIVGMLGKVRIPHYILSRSNDGSSLFDLNKTDFQIILMK